MIVHVEDNHSSLLNHSLKIIYMFAQIILDVAARLAHALEADGKDVNKDYFYFASYDSPIRYDTYCKISKYKVVSHYF